MRLPVLFSYALAYLALNIVETCCVELYVHSSTVGICLHIFTFIKCIVEMH